MIAEKAPLVEESDVTALELFSPITILSDTEVEFPPALLSPQVITEPSFSKAAKALSVLKIVLISLLITPTVTLPEVAPPLSTLILDILLK